jgi:hypothetical protein
MRVKDKMMSKKDMLTLGVLAVGGVAVASSFAGGGDTGALEGKKGRAGGILGSQQGYGAAPTIYNLPAGAPVTFPEGPKFDIGKFLGEPIKTETDIGRGAAGVSSAGKKEVIYGGYKPSGASYVFGGKAFEAQAAKEVVSVGYSPTLGAAFGISPEIASGGTTKKTPVPTKKREITGRTATPGRMGMGKSYATAHGGN